MRRAFILLLLLLLVGLSTARYIFLIFVMLTDTSLVFSCCRMSEMEEHEFIQDYLTWMKPGLDQEALTIPNFGYDRPLPFPSIALTPNRNLGL